jgi:glucose/arabinose dehydrogenase
MDFSIKSLLFGLTFFQSVALTSAQLPNNVTMSPVFGTEAANKMARPLWMGEIPGLKSHFLVLTQGYSTGIGIVYLFEPSQDGTYTRKEFMSLPVRQGANEMGLLGCAFHPKFTENHKYYLYYIQQSAGGDTAVIVERRVDATFKKDSGEESRRVFSQFKGAINHNGGTMAFGKEDGFLYVGIGDDGTGGNGQSRAKTLGSILRIDVDSPANGLGYGIPTDNPFVADPNVRKEIWVYGLRNPWKWSFDPLTGDLWIGDVGEEKEEEIDIAKKGDNMGWSIMEGSSCIISGCNESGKVLPLKTFRRDSAQSIIGGLVYRGNASSPFYGAFFFADYPTKHVWAITQKDGRMTALSRVAGAASYPVAFAQDSDNNLYLIGFEPGTIYKINHESFNSKPVNNRNRPFTSPPNIKVRAGALMVPTVSGKHVPFKIQNISGRTIVDYRNIKPPASGIIPLAPGCYRLTFDEGVSTSVKTVIIP